MSLLQTSCSSCLRHGAAVLEQGAESLPTVVFRCVLRDKWGVTAFSWALPKPLFKPVTPSELSREETAEFGPFWGCLQQNLPINRNSFIPCAVLDLFLYFWGIFCFSRVTWMSFHPSVVELRGIVPLAHVIQARIPCDLSNLSRWIYFGTLSDLSAGVRVWRSRINADNRGQSVAKEKKNNHNFLTELRNLKETWAPSPHSMIFFWAPQFLLKSFGCLFYPLLLFLKSF